MAEPNKCSQDSWAPGFNISKTIEPWHLQVNGPGGGHGRPAEECGVKKQARPFYKAISRLVSVVPLNHAPDKILCPEQRLSPKQQYSCMFYFSFP